MLYPFTITFDAYIQASSYKEARKIAKRIEEDARIDTNQSEFIDDVYEVSDYAVNDVEDE